MNLVVYKTLELCKSCYDKRRASLQDPCSVKGCLNSRHAGSVCETHNRPARESANPFCKFEGCENRSRTKSSDYCYGHYTQLYRGVPLSPLRKVRKKNSAVSVDGFKVCYFCNESLPTDRFGTQKTSSDGFSYICKECTRWKMLLRRYGLSRDDFVSMLATQGGCCAICRGVEPGGIGNWHVDHDHAKGLGRHAVRAILCARCNLMLGSVQDSPGILLAAAAYLISHGAETRGVTGAAFDEYLAAHAVAG